MEAIDTSVLNITFVCLTLWLGEVCKDDANTDTAQNTIVLGSLVDKPNEPKTGCQVIGQVKKIGK